MSLLERFGFRSSDLRSKGLITREGAVLMGESFTVDAHARRPVRVVTHIHADHMLGLGESVRMCEKLLMTPATYELARLLCRVDLNPDKLETLVHGRTLEYDEERLTLLRAGHILGSSQVLVETREGHRVVYTGDFKLPEAEIVESDLLIIEATYGNPSCTRPFEDEVENQLVRLIMDSLKEGSVHIFGYHGKLQEVAEILRRSGVTEPILMSGRVYSVAKICERHGMKMGEFLREDSEEAEEIRGERYIGLHHMSSSKDFAGGGTKIYLSGWEFQAPVRKVGKDKFQVALSDHSDFEQLMEYVRESDPRYVVTDNFRVGDAKALAREIKRRLGKRARPMP